MNEQLFGQVSGDDYTDALTLGPVPRVMDGLDLTVQAGDVFAQFARKVDTGVQPWDDREYLLHPGSRHVDNVCGARFRSAVSGVPALITASLTGPDQPQIGPIFGDSPLVGPALLLPTDLKPDASGGIVGFSGLPPSGYSAVLIYVNNTLPGGRDVWVFLEADLSVGVPGVGPIPIQEQLFFPLGSKGYFVLGLPASTISIGLAHGTINAPIEVGVWPTNLAPGFYLPAVGAPLFNQVPTPVIAPGPAVVTDLATPYFGPANLVILNNSAQAFLVELASFDPTGAQVAVLFLANLPANSNINQPIWLPPGRNKVVIQNVGAANAQIDVAIVGQYAGLSA